MLNIQFHICDDHFDKYVVKTGFNCSFKASFMSNVVVCNSLFMSMFYFDSVALYCVVCYLLFYLLHLLRMKVL